VSHVFTLNYLTVTQQKGGARKRNRDEHNKIFNHYIYQAEPEESIIKYMEMFIIVQIIFYRGEKKGKFNPLTSAVVCEFRDFDDDRCKYSYSR
jgi:hypothetical protein